MKKSYYHATSIKNLESMIENGIKPGIDGIVYLAESEQDALKFISIRCFDDILVLEVKLPKEKVFETFDHSYAFFKCKAFGYPENIPIEFVTKATKYEMNRGEK